MSAMKQALISAVEAVMVARGIPVSDVDAFAEIQAGIVDGSIPLPVVESLAPLTVTFADGFGNWHAGIDRPAARLGDVLPRARAAIRDELEARGAIEKGAQLRVARTPLHDTLTHVFYGEVS